MTVPASIQTLPNQPLVAAHRLRQRLADATLMLTISASLFVLIAPDIDLTTRIMAGTTIGLTLLFAYRIDVNRLANQAASTPAGQNAYQGKQEKFESMASRSRARRRLFAPASSIRSSPGAPFDPETGLDSMVSPLS